MKLMLVSVPMQIRRYMYGMSGNNIGLQMLLEKVPRSRKWRCLRSTQVWNRSNPFKPTKSLSWL